MDSVYTVLESRALKEDFSLGGFLTLAMESQMLHRAKSSVPQRIRLSGDVLRLEREPIWSTLAVALGLDFETNGKEAGGPSGSKGGLHDGIPDYSLEPINHLVLADSSQVPVLQWDKNLVREVSAKICSREREVIGIHFRQPEVVASPFGSAFSELVRQLLRLERLEPYSFMVLGDNIPKDVSTHPRVFFAKDEGWSLEQQLVASSQTAFFIGEASGFCTAAIFGRAPYLICKDPGQHAGTVARDIGPAGRISFSTDWQFFLREIPSSYEAETLILNLLSDSQFRRGAGEQDQDCGGLE